MLLEAAAQAGKRLAYHAKWLESSDPQQPQQERGREKGVAAAQDDGW